MDRLGAVEKSTIGTMPCSAYRAVATTDKRFHSRLGG